MGTDEQAQTGIKEKGMMRRLNSYILVLLVSLALLLAGVGGQSAGGRPKKVYKLAKGIADRPVAIDVNTGQYISLRAAANRAMMRRRRSLGQATGELEGRCQWLSELEGEGLRNLVVERLKYYEPDREVWIVGHGSVTLAEVIAAVQEDNELGRSFVRMEQLHVADLKQKVATGEYQIP